VFGRAFRAAGVAALETGLAQQAAELCENLADRDLIRPADSDRFAFRHILIQEVAYNTLPRTERARLHGEAGRWVESASEGREVAVAEILAFHYREAAVLSAALDPTSEATARAKESAGRWLLKAADVAAAAGATPEAVRHIRGAFDYVDPARLPRLHERIGDLTAGDFGLEEYRMALDLYTAGNAPVDDQLRALAGILMVATRWQGSVGVRMSPTEMNELRARGWGLLERAKDPRSMGRFLAADAFYPFWMQAVGEPRPQDIAEAEESARRASKIAAELDDQELASAALDALGGCAATQFDWPGALETAQQRLTFEEKLGLYERLDSHSMVAWMSYLMGDLATAEADSAVMVALTILGRWDEAVTMFYRALEAWNDAGRHAAGYGLRGFVAGLDIGRARGDARLISAASEPIMSILSRFPADHGHLRLTAHVNGESGFTSDDPVLFPRYPPEMVERRLALAADLRAELPPNLLPALLERAVEQKIPLLEAQIRRAMGLANRDPAELTAAIAIWEPVGALPNFGRARAERGLYSGDQSETEAGLAILKKLGDVNYVDRFAARV
jgi:tetratricopeptide (TPR) repeat protein